MADLGAGEVGGEDPGERVAGFAAFLGAGLTESNAVAGAPAFDDGVGVVEVEVVEFGADVLPAEGAAEAEVEGFGIEGAAVGVEGGDAAGGGAAGDGELSDLGEAESAGELVEGEAGAPGLASGGEAEGVFPALEPGAGGAGPDGGGGFSVAAAVAAVEDFGGAAVGFEDESFGVFDDLAEAGGDVADEEFLAVGGFAEVEAFGFVAAGVDAGEGANGDGDGLEGFGGGEAAGFTGEGGGDVVFAVEEEGLGFTGDADTVVLGGEEGGSRKKEKDQEAHWAKISPAMGAASAPPVPPGRATTRRNFWLKPANQEASREVPVLPPRAGLAAMAVPSETARRRPSRTGSGGAARRRWKARASQAGVTRIRRAPRARSWRSSGVAGGVKSAPARARARRAGSMVVAWAANQWLQERARAVGRSRGAV